MNLLQRFGRNILWLFLLFGFLGCALKPEPIYNAHPKRPKRSNREPTTQSVSADTLATEGNDEFADSDADGDTGIVAEDATYNTAVPAASYNLSASTQTWNLANGLLPFLNSPYKYGGESMDGVDCSGLVKAVFDAAFQKQLPHKAAYQYKLGAAVAKKRLVAGDLVFFYDKRSRRIGHVGLYLADDQFIHSIAGKGVVISNLNDGYWVKHYAGARRLLDN